MTQHEQCIVLYDGTRAPDQAEELTVVTLPDLVLDMTILPDRPVRMDRSHLLPSDPHTDPEAHTPFKVPIRIFA